jgi:hypothetical protein
MRIAVALPLQLTLSVEVGDIHASVGFRKTRDNLVDESTIR